MSPLVPANLIAKRAAVVSCSSNVLYRTQLERITYEDVFIHDDTEA